MATGTIIFIVIVVIVFLMILISAWINSKRIEGLEGVSKKQKRSARKENRKEKESVVAIERIAEEIVQEEVEERRRRQEREKKAKEKLKEILEGDSALSTIIKKIWEKKAILGRVVKFVRAPYCVIEIILKGKNGAIMKIIIESAPKTYSVIDKVSFSLSDIPGLGLCLNKNLGEFTDKERTLIEKWLVKRYKE